MVGYKLEVTTGDLKSAGTWDHIYVTLFGTEGQSERTELDNFGIDFSTGTVFNVYFSVVKFRLSSHIWLFRLVRAQLISQLIDACCRQSAWQPQEPRSAAACHSVCTRRVVEQIKSHL
ncbi:Hydroperoxide isomerase ALOXE3 [Liparis tanakae]|uniref:Hydroperoxide isomerase ALOXE3 n=1 Tax=Liparis tanakae TaxID=230148 RepID=A0A4Z2E9I2_9TELE|nr:Hydroperoxide isomerase ALOXE3 [Liparis tanakae]